ncbi:MAG: hypothetical protein U1B83_09075, partial [Candidatus Cloacimonadaceae bacterium]|nr:hypothetical protein [Candidatus Cloacimonadaceae bacterium]
MTAIYKTLMFLISMFLCSLLWAQNYPSIHFLTGFDRRNSGGMYGGPDWAQHDLQRFDTSVASPLQVTGIYSEHHYWEDSGDVHTNSYTDFNGSVELLPEHFIVRSPMRLVNSSTEPQYRIAKIDYNGYYLEDCLSYSPDGTDYLLKAWHYYDANMIITETILKYASPLSWKKLTSIRDNLGRRIEDTTYSSADSLQWNVEVTTLYTYGDTPYPQAYQFEKHANYMPEYILNRLTITPVFFMDDQYPVSSIMKIVPNPNGGWLVFPYQLICTFSPNQISMSSVLGTISWDHNGLLVAIGG